MPNTLAIVPNGTVSVNEAGDVLLSDKTVSGLDAFVARWPGPVALVARSTTADDGNVGTAWRQRDSFSFDVIATPDVEGAVRSLNPRLLLAGHEVAQEELLQAARTTVLISEFDALERIRLTLLTAESRKDRARIWAGGLRRAQILRRMVRAADGVQANGYPAWVAARRHNNNTVLFFDTRLTKAQIQEYAARTVRESTAGVLRLGFSGRIIPTKGPQFAVEAVDALNREGVTAELTLYGSGQLLPRLSAQPYVRSGGSLPFSPDWIREIPRQIDVMLLPHLQGDPAGTFLEASGLGVPVVGFNSAAWRELVARDQLGVAVPLGRADLLAQATAQLWESAPEREALRQRGIAFMNQHHCDAEFDRRVDHLLRTAGL